MSKLQTQTIAKITLLILIIAIQSCKTIENTNPANSCRLSKYVVNTYTNSPDYVREMKYDNDGNLIIHKVNSIQSSSQPTSIVGVITGEKDSIVYRNKEIHKLYHFIFNNGVLKWDLETEKEYFYVDGKVSRIVTKNIPIQYRYITSVGFDKYFYNPKGKLETKVSYQKRLLYKGVDIPTITTIPYDSIVSERDTTFYTFENNNLVKTINHIDFSSASTITQTEYSGYDNKINPFYKLPIETSNFTNLSENNFSKKSEIKIIYSKLDTGFGPKDVKSERVFTQSFSYDSKSYPIDIDNSNKLSVFVKKDLPYFVYECK